MSWATEGDPEVGRRVARLAWWTPLPPLASGIADHNAMLLPAIARRAELVVVARGDAGAAPAGVPVVAPDSLAAARADLAVYHVGNHDELHGWVLDAAVARPGLVVLHDLSLLDLYAARPRGVGAVLAAELDHDFGPAVRDQLPAEPSPGWIRRHRLELGLLRRVVDTSLGVVVHSPWARARIARRFAATPVFEVPLAARVADPLPDAGSARRSLGLGPDGVAVGVLGAVAEHKLVELAIEAFLAAHDDEPATRLVLAGRAVDDAAVARALGMLRRSGLGTEHVAIHLDADAGTFAACLAACDAVVDARGAAAGAVPATVMAALGAGKVAITRDLPQLAHLDERWWRAVPDAPDVVEHLTTRILDLARRPADARAAGAAAREWVARSADPAIVADRYLRITRSLPATPAAVPARDRLRADERIPVNVWGDFDSTTGLMEAGRAALRALEQVAELTLVPVRTAAARSTTRRVVPPSALAERTAGALDLLLVNCSELVAVPDRDLAGCDRVVGWWYWEMPTLSQGLALQADRVDEIWAPSAFTRDAFAAAVARPTHVVPPVVDLPLPPRVSRADFGLPEEAVLVFFNFDTHSTDARKNPWGVIEAFAAAFDARERSGPVRLVMKVHNLHRSEVRALVEPLRAAVRSVAGILLDDDLTRAEMNALLACTDIYASLHRSEGFGLGLAEAMFLGKPAIATAYSGNVDFMTPTNSCLVGYRLRPVRSHDHRYFPVVANVYEPGMTWAEPEVAQAARWLRFLVDHPDARERIGRRGARDIRRTNSPAAVARVLHARLAAARTPVSLRRRATERAS